MHYVSIMYPHLSTGQTQHQGHWSIYAITCFCWGPLVPYMHPQWGLATDTQCCCRIYIHSWFLYTLIGYHFSCEWIADQLICCSWSVFITIKTVGAGHALPNYIWVPFRKVISTGVYMQSVPNSMPFMIPCRNQVMKSTGFVQAQCQWLEQESFYNCISTCLRMTIHTCLWRFDMAVMIVCDCLSAIAYAQLITSSVLQQQPSWSFLLLLHATWSLVETCDALFKLMAHEALYLVVSSQSMSIRACVEDV